MTVVLILAAWLFGLAAFVVLKARQPRWEHPRPPLAEPSPRRLSEAA